MTMEYEYERGIIGMLGGIEYRHFIDLSDYKKELKEVYRKAKAFDKIRNVDKDFYKEYGYYPNEEEWWYDASNIIEKYEELHGGHKQ